MDDAGAVWSKHWYELKHGRSFHGGLFSLYRFHIRARAVNRYLDRHFPKDGVLVECGSGSSQTSARIVKRARRLFAMDISSVALDEARQMKVLDGLVRADINNLPFKDGSLDGVWNLGVIEHYGMEEIRAALGEFHRVMKGGGTLMMFWPSRIALDRAVFMVLEFFINLYAGNDFRFFPDEPSRLKSKDEGKAIMGKAGFSDCEVHFPVWDMFTEYVVICRKPSTEQD
ncbi:MAG: class I SAM-dependent methyltransferase [Candidatus Altiarchaeota archaeon]